MDTQVRETYGYSDTKAMIESAIDLVKLTEAREGRCREKSLVLTKLEEALMWLDKVAFQIQPESEPTRN